jgi:hypothetical protein
MPLIFANSKRIEADTTAYSAENQKKKACGAASKRTACTISAKTVSRKRRSNAHTTIS